MTDAPEPDAVLLTRLATRLTAWYTLGGRLTATSSSIVFHPRWLERTFFDAQSFSAAWGDVEDVSVLDRNLSFGSLPVGIRRRLQVTVRDGGRETFVVGNVDQVADELRKIQDHYA